jgi:PPOX class probable F420-dependent enzyme
MDYATTSVSAVRPFLDGPYRTVLGTLRKDGSPHLVVVDYIVDAEGLLLNGRAGRSWVAHLRRDGRASALVHDPDHVQHWVSIVGTAELVREGDEAAVEDAKVMARRYGDDAEQFTGQHRVTWRLVPVRVIERGMS